MQLWGVTIVKDDLDVLPYCLAHLVAEGVQGLIVEDSRSSDGTADWLHDYAPRGVAVVVVQGRDFRYPRERRLSELVDLAFSLGADWVLPFDAEDCWYSSDGRRLATVFSGFTAIDVVRATLHYYYPSDADDAREPNPFRRIRHCDPTPFTKVALGSRGHVLCEDCRDVTTDAVAKTASGVTVGHFPWRSYAQFKLKVDNGLRAYRTRDLKSLDTQWRQYADLLEEQGLRGLRVVYEEWLHEPERELAERPVPWVGTI